MVHQNEFCLFCVEISASRRFFLVMKQHYPKIFIFHVCKFLKKSANMPKIGQKEEEEKNKTKTKNEALEQKECNDRWYSFKTLLFKNKHHPTLLLLHILIES